MGLTGRGRGFLSFRARALSALLPAAVEATNSTSSSLWLGTASVSGRSATGVINGNLQESAYGDSLACFSLERPVSPKTTRHHAPHTLCKKV